MDVSKEIARWYAIRQVTDTTQKYLMPVILIGGIGVITWFLLKKF